ncbi:hypothetical protein [Legionella nagasakiensis]|uniref:hypothetical protein n=1 Tax=Legionella nagasakiensis TaxID=535290 RepID=UPI0010558B69|nr:hypothetical protein [Legionella nagasakiensis]
MKKIIMGGTGLLMLFSLGNFAYADDNVTKQIQLLNSQIQAQLQKIQADQQNQIKQLNTQIQTQLKQLQQQLQDQIQKVNTDTQKQMQTMQTTLENQIKQVQQQATQAAKK